MLHESNLANKNTVSQQVFEMPALNVNKYHKLFAKDQTDLQSVSSNALFQVDCSATFSSVVQEVQVRLSKWWPDQCSPSHF